MQRFNDVLVETIDEIIRNVFEDEIAKIIFRYLKTGSPLDKKVQIFSDVLPKILGEGHIIIEDLILETLYSKYKLELKWKKDYSFTDYIMDLSKQVKKRES